LGSRLNASKRAREGGLSKKAAGVAVVVATMGGSCLSTCLHADDVRTEYSSSTLCSSASTAACDMSGNATISSVVKSFVDRKETTTVSVARGTSENTQHDHKLVERRDTKSVRRDGHRRLTLAVESQSGNLSSFSSNTTRWSMSDCTGRKHKKTRVLLASEVRNGITFLFFRCLRPFFTPQQLPCSPLTHSPPPPLPN
jgi:hypothetical protein